MLWNGSKPDEQDVDAAGQPRQAWFTHGSHNLEVIWTIVPGGVLLFIALYQMDVWAEFRIRDSFPPELQATLATLGINPNVEIERTVGTGESARKIKVKLPPGMPSPK